MAQQQEVVIWKDVIGYEGLYRICNNGEVKSLDRSIHNPIHGSINIKGRTLKPRVDSYGYYSLGICKDGRPLKIRLHRLIALNFIPNPEGKSFINHKNGNKLDNRIENLEWVTPAENNTHSYRTGLRKASLGKRYTGQYNSIICTDLEGNELAIFKSCQIAARLMKTDRGNINMVLRGEKESYNGFKYKYAVDAKRD